MNKKLEKAALSNLKKTERLLLAGWTTGVNHIVYHGQDSYCLIGAVEEADGSGEKVAKLALALAIRRRSALRQLHSEIDAGQMGSGIRDVSWRIITGFNDSFQGKYHGRVPKKIIKTIQRARKYVPRAAMAVQILELTFVGSLSRAAAHKEIRNIFRK